MTTKKNPDAWRRFVWFPGDLVILKRGGVDKAPPRGTSIPPQKDTTRSPTEKQEPRD